MRSFLRLLYGFFSWFCCVVPLWFLPFPLWLDAIIGGLLIMLRVFPVLSLPLWIWALITVLSGPLDSFSVLFFVFLAAYVVLLVLDLIAFIHSRRSSS